MAVYGDQLAFFPELFSYIGIYTMKPNTVAGYSNRVLIKNIKGIIQELKGGELVIEGETLNATEVPTLWTREDIKTGLFVSSVDAEEWEIYRVTNKINYKKQGNFNVYTLQLLTGVTDKQESNNNLSFGNYG